MSFYIDTNIFVYSALAHPIYGKACKQIIDDIQNGRIEVYCSYLVPIELLGSLAQIDIEKASIAVIAFLSLPVRLIEIDKETILEASRIMLKTGVSYDSIHAACMKKEGLDSIITEDVDHWRKIRGIKIVRPLEYKV
jgi:predicted nucleic acid-binding protein